MRVIDDAADAVVRLVHVLRRHQARRILHELRVSLVALPLRASHFYVAEAARKGARCVEVRLKQDLLAVQLDSARVALVPTPHWPLQWAVDGACARVAIQGRLRSLVSRGGIEGKGSTS